MAVSVPPAAAAPPTPPPVHERPPDDRYCDLVLNGGVASGVVYPWALVELARVYRFRRIGGNSVGAIAAALAAAAEYGRCCGNPHAFEPLRRAPLQLAEEQADTGDPLMLRLFQPASGVRRLFDLFVAAVRRANDPQLVGWARNLLLARDLMALLGIWVWWLLGVLALPALSLLATSGARLWLLATLIAGTLTASVAEAWLRRRARPMTQARATAVLGLLLMLALATATWLQGSALPLLGALGWTVPMLALAAARLWPQLRALRANGWGLCSGRAQPRQPGSAPEEKGLVEWLHQGIQRAAGRERHDPPLTFADLWAVRRPGEMADADGRREPGIELLMYSTNVTLARPVVLPVTDRNARLFYCREEWSQFFPPTLLDALWAASVPYAPADDSDPPVDGASAHLRELPSGGMPIAVAARLSLSFPLLFSCVPVYAIDYEMKRGTRQLRRCLLTDGGLCTNFPIHLFDAAHPRWPTFGLMLGRRIPSHDSDAVWLPDHHRAGRADNWSRSVPGAQGGAEPGPVSGLWGLLAGMLTAALHWNDHLTSRLAPVRNRVLRIALRPGEGQLNIAMPGTTILRMAHEYGTAGGRLLVRHFAGEAGRPSAAWREHLYVRAASEIRMLGRHLRGYGHAIAGHGFSQPLADVLAEAVHRRPLRAPEGRVPDPEGRPLTPRQAAALLDAARAIAALERTLDRDEDAFGPYQPQPPMQMQMRPRI